MLYIYIYDIYKVYIHLCAHVCLHVCICVCIYTYYNMDASMELSLKDEMNVDDWST